MKKFKPPTDNVIFLDTEFSSLDPYRGEILSVGIVKVGGEELYLELEHDGYVEPWVKKNIIPTLKDIKVSRKKAIDEINKFVGKNKPYAVAFINQFDTLYTYKLFGIDKHPFYWLPIDFASIIFALGIDPEEYVPEKNSKFFENIGIDIGNFTIHNALDDAKLLREVYLKLT